jgi:agmatinase
MGLSVRADVPRTRTLQQAAVLGVPLDLTESFRAGTAAAPARIREVWGTALEDYSPILDRDLDGLQLERLGELSLGGLSLDQALDHIETVASPLFEEGFVLAFGGEHTATLALFRAARSVHRDVLLVQLDAHLDLRSSYDGQDIGHATWLYWLGREYGLESTVQLGVRSGTREEFARARECAWSSPRLEMPSALRQRIGRRPVYLTIDIDVLDPSAAPGTGCPEPGGPGFSELEAFIHGLMDLNVIGADIMEVLPDCDPGDITSLAAAKLGRELLLMFVGDP